MHEALLAPGGAYSILATTNSMRFQSAVFQRLIERALAARPDGGILFIPYDVHWWEYLKAAGLGEDDSLKAPIGRRLAYEYHQDVELLYGPRQRRQAGQGWAITLDCGKCEIRVA